MLNEQRGTTNDSFFCRPSVRFILLFVHLSYLLQRSSLNTPLGSDRKRFQSEAQKERSSLNAHPSTLRSAPTGDAFEAKRRKNTHPSSLIAHPSTLNLITPNTA
ncbi:hypothetical protein [Prevotella koreensis]